MSIPNLYRNHEAHIKALVISEEASERQSSINKCLSLGYEVESADSLKKLLSVTNTFFDMVLISSRLRSIGINYLSMNFKQSFHLGKKPLFLLIDGALPSIGSDKDLLNSGIIDGVMVVK